MLDTPALPGSEVASGACAGYAASAIQMAQAADAFGKVVAAQPPLRTFRDTKPKRDAAKARAKRKAQRAERKKQRR